MTQRNHLLGRRALCAGLGTLGAMLALPPLAHAQQRTVRLVVPTAPGGSVDSSGRLLADFLNRGNDARYIVENRAGAGGSIGIQSVVKSPPDGSTYVVGIAATLSVQPAVQALSYDPLRDLAPVAVFAQGGLVVALPSASPVKTLNDLRALAAEKKELSFGTGGPGTFGHLTGELIKSQMNIPMRHIPYRGAAPAVTDLAAGLLDLAVVDAFSAAPHVQSGRVRILAIAGPSHHPTFPQVPTLQEQGLAFTRGTWVGLFAPAGVPPATLERMAGEIRALSSNADFRGQLTKLGFTPMFMGPAEVHSMLTAEVDEWRRTARAANVRVE